MKVEYSLQILHTNRVIQSKNINMTTKIRSRYTYLFKTCGTRRKRRDVENTNDVDAVVVTGYMQMEPYKGYRGR